MEAGILHLHSALRYIILLMLISSIIVALTGINEKKIYTRGIKRLHFFTRVLLMAQGTIGIALYFMKGYPSQFANITNLQDQSRFFLLKHLIAMLIGIIVCSIGYAGSLKLETDREKFKRIAIFYTIGLLIILSAIPFPFIQSWASWF